MVFEAAEVSRHGGFKTGKVCTAQASLLSEFTVAGLEGKSGIQTANVGNQTGRVKGNHGSSASAKGFKHESLL
jgi:hypothetical protein